MATRKKSSAALCKLRGKLASLTSSGLGVTMMEAKRVSTFKWISRPRVSPSFRAGGAEGLLMVCGGVVVDSSVDGRGRVAIRRL